MTWYMIIFSFCHSFPTWVKVVRDTLISQQGNLGLNVSYGKFVVLICCCLRHPNISVRQLGAVREDLPLEEKLMVMNESWVMAPASSSISGLHNEYPHTCDTIWSMLWCYTRYYMWYGVILDMIFNKILDRKYDMVYHIKDMI